MTRVTRTVLVGGLALGLNGCGPSTPELQTIADATAALGGADRVRGVRTLVSEGAGRQFNLGQNVRPDGELPVFDVAEFSLEMDFEAGRWRSEHLRTATFPTGLAPVVRQIAGLDGDVAFNVSPAGDASRASSLVARERRGGLRHHPIGLLQAAAADGASVTNHREEDGRDVVDVVTADGDQYTLHVDATTRLPAKVVSAGSHNNLGDVALETEFGEYADQNGLRLPTLFVSRIDRYTVGELRVSNSVNAATSDLAAPADVQAAADPVPTADVAVDTIAPGVWHLAGQSHHSVVVELDDSLVLIEAPQHDTRTLAVIARARELQPDKPLTTVVSTHHHFDHSGGVRAAVSEGLTVVAHNLSKPFFEMMVARQHTLVPDALARDPQPLRVETVGDALVLGEGGRRTVELYPVLDNSHAETMLMAYLPHERLLAEVDLYTPPPPNASGGRSPFAESLIRNIEQRGLRVDRILALHGRVVQFESLREAVRQEGTSR